MKFTIETYKSKEKVIQILRENTLENYDAEKTSDDPTSDKFFKGEVTQDSFKISRRITSRNSFLPIITGEIIGNSTCTMVKIKMGLLYYVKIFMIVWFSFVVFHGFLARNLGGTFEETDNYPLYLPIFNIFMLFAGALGISWSYGHECKKAKKKLNELLGGEK